MHMKKTWILNKVEKTLPHCFQNLPAAVASSCGKGGLRNRTITQIKNIINLKHSNIYFNNSIILFPTNSASNLAYLLICSSQ